MKNIGGNISITGGSILDTYIAKPSTITVADTINIDRNSYGGNEVILPNYTPSAFGSGASSTIKGGKLNIKNLNKVIESTYLIMSNKYYKNVKTDLRKVLKTQKEKFIKKV